MDTKIPTTDHPFFVIYERNNAQGVKKFDTVDDARLFIVENEEGHGYYMLGLYDFNSRTYLPDGLDDDGVRRLLRDEYVEKNFPLETERMKQEKQSREAVREVIQAYLTKFGLILLTIIFSVGLNIGLNLHLNPTVGSCLAVLFFSGSTLGYLVDWKIKTWGGRTLAEKISEKALIIGYVIGTALTVLSFDFTKL